MADSNVVALMPRRGFTVRPVHGTWALYNRKAFGDEVIQSFPSTQRADAFIHCCRLNETPVDHLLTLDVVTTT